MKAAQLLAEIESVFSPVPMPARGDLSFHAVGCAECQETARDLEQLRGKEVGPEIIRLVHQELSHLSPQAWLWLLPGYLRFCLTADALYSRVETEFLIYTLNPAPEFQKDTLLRLSLLDASQVACLIHFVAGCATHEFWREYFPASIEGAQKFLRAVATLR